MKIAKIGIKNYLGIEEMQLSPEDINIYKGPNGSGKTSILEGIENVFNSNPKRRTETIRHGEDEAILFIETDNDITIERKLRNGKQNALKITSDRVDVKSTEGQLKKMFSGDVFRPLDFIDKDYKKQTDDILSTIPVVYSDDKIVEWFGTLNVMDGVNPDKHVLMILKDIENRHYNTRQDKNREIKTLESQVKGIKDSLPDNYDGKEWENVSIQELYAAVTEAEKTNNYISKGNAAKENYDQTVKNANDDFDNRIKSLDFKYKSKADDIQNIIDLAESKIEKCNVVIGNSDIEKINKTKELENELTAKINSLREEYNNKITQECKVIDDNVQDQKDVIDIQKTKISNKQVELSGLKEMKQNEIDSIESERKTKLESLKETMIKWNEYLDKTEPIDIEPLKKKAEHAETMRNYLREWDRMIDLQNNQIAEKQRYSDQLTTVIERARELPGIIISEHKLPIDGISVDSDGKIRINGTLLDGLSDGEKLDAALKIAHYQMGELRIMCLDRFEKLDPENQAKVIEFCESNNIQAFITVPALTESNEVEISHKL